MARSIDASFRRIQFTPDLLPTDVTGVNIYNMKTSDFEFKPGPDLRPHRAGGRDQPRLSPHPVRPAGMHGGEPTSAWTGRPTASTSPFMVIATQNPIELAGTYPLPEAQLDRFLMKIAMGYPDKTEEARILTDQQSRPTRWSPSPPSPRWTRCASLVQEVKRVNISDEVKDYIVAISDATRHHPDIALGVSPRGSLSLMKSARALAYIGGTDLRQPGRRQGAGPLRPLAPRPPAPAPAHGGTPAGAGCGRDTGPGARTRHAGVLEEGGTPALVYQRPRASG